MSEMQRLVEVLRETAAVLETSGSYQWGNMGHCNCGHLAQTITRLTGAEIHRSAMEDEGDWRERARDHCPHSGRLIDDIIAQMLELGMTLRDIGDLERLSGAAVLAAIPGDRLPLARHRRDDVVLYMRTWADVIERAPQSVARVA